MTYKITIFIPYEGDASYYFSSLEEVREWIKRNKHPLDEISVEVITKSVDIYELMEEK